MLELGRAALELAYVEDVVRQREQVVRGAAYLLSAVGLHLCVLGALLGDVEQPADAVDGGAHVVAHAAQEAGFGGVCALRFEHCVFQLLLVGELRANRLVYVVGYEGDRHDPALAASRLHGGDLQPAMVAAAEDVAKAATGFLESFCNGGGVDKGLEAFAVVRVDDEAQHMERLFPVVAFGNFAGEGFRHAKQHERAVVEVLLGDPYGGFRGGMVHIEEHNAPLGDGRLVDADAHADDCGERGVGDVRRDDRRRDQGQLERYEAGERQSVPEVDMPEWSRCAERCPECGAEITDGNGVVEVVDDELSCRLERWCSEGMGGVCFPCGFSARPAALEVRGFGATINWFEFHCCMAVAKRKVLPWQSSPT